MVDLRQLLTKVTDPHGVKAAQQKMKALSSVLAGRDQKEITERLQTLSQSEGPMGAVGGKTKQLDKGLVREKKNAIHAALPLGTVMVKQLALRKKFRNPFFRLAQLFNKPETNIAFKKLDIFYSATLTEVAAYENDPHKPLTLTERIALLEKAAALYGEAFDSAKASNCQRAAENLRVKQQEIIAAQEETAKTGEEAAPAIKTNGQLVVAAATEVQPVQETKPAPADDARALNVPELLPAAKEPAAQPSTDGDAPAPAPALHIPTKEDKQLVAAQRAEESGNRALRPKAAVTHYIKAATLYEQLGMIEDAQRCTELAKSAQQELEKEAGENQAESK